MFGMSARTIEPLWEIVERHLDEADYLAACWREALDEPDHTLEELAGGIEARLFAHLDGLALAGAPALTRLCWPALEANPDTPLALVASLAILAQGTRDDCARLLALLDATQTGDERWTGIVEALALHDRPELSDWLSRQLEDHETEPGPRVAAITHVLTRRRVPLGDRLTALLHNEDPAVLAAAATLARRGSPAQLQRCVALTEHGDPTVVAAAVQTGLVCALPGAWASARHWAFEAPHCSFRRAALTWLALGDDQSDHDRLLTLFDDPDRRSDALWAAGFCGRVAAVDAAINYLADALHAPLAAELITAIAGLPTDDDTLWREVDPAPREDQSLPALADDRLDQDLGLDPEQLLPTPAPHAVASWWAARRPGFDPGGRFIAGQALDSSSLTRALITAPLRRRHALGLLVQLRSGAASWPATRDWAVNQLHALRS